MTGRCRDAGSAHDDRRAHGSVAKLRSSHAGEDAEALAVAMAWSIKAGPSPASWASRIALTRVTMDALVRDDLVVAQVGAVDDVERWRLALRTMRAGDGEGGPVV